MANFLEDNRAASRLGKPFGAAVCARGGCAAATATGKAGVGGGDVGAASRRVSPAAFFAFIRLRAAVLSLDVVPSLGTFAMPPWAILASHLPLLPFPGVLRGLRSFAVWPQLEAPWVGCKHFPH